ncbi:ferredoxin [Achromobacter sp. RTa]|uniref:(2Fe-2S)-binding protein n=1 Tax=Achromobacter sp. RTa TaxID=1532557 RepID=UPI00050DD223|nr:(2Fe-2S)-binding protein [Achromobacter sp. RTa]KGD96073.1 ferredoxin [Achromobacter sp. RTa]
MKPLLRRVSAPASAPLSLTWNGLPLQAHEGDTVLTALLLASQQLRVTLGEGAPRAGFCLMGACQDCWVQTANGARLRACSTAAQDGMELLSAQPGELACK